MTDIPADGVGAQYREVVLRTYRYLRLGMAVLVALLGAAVVLEIISSNVQLDSISAYYYSPAHAVFVASLCAVGACLIVYRGQSDLEDAILNGCGFLAFVVAFIPTRASEARPCDPNSQFCTVAPATVEANMWALLVTSAISLALAFGVSVWKRKRSTSRPLPAGARAAYFVLLAGFIALAIFFIGWRSTFLSIGHYTAAIALFVGIVMVVGLNGYRLGVEGSRVSGVRSHFLNRYALGFYIMVVSTVAIIAAGRSGALPHWIFYLESSLIAQFAMFWIVQTVELWNEPPPPIPPPSAIRQKPLARTT